MWVWTKLSAARWRDAWEERFHALDNTNLVITELAGKPTVRVEIYCQSKADAQRIKTEFGGSVREVKQQNWAAMAVPHIDPIKIRDRLLIVSDADEAAVEAHRRTHPKRHVISIPVEMAFGTGDHPTTATCLRLLCDLPISDASLLDLGCGTGLLAIAAKKLGAGAVEGFDFDPAAVSAARKNARRNGVRIPFAQLDVLQWQPEKTYDYIFANIFADVLTASYPTMKRALRPDGTLILSGVLDKHAPELLEEGHKAGFDFQSVLQRGKWVTAVAKIRQA